MAFLDEVAVGLLELEYVLLPKGVFHFRVVEHFGELGFRRSGLSRRCTWSSLLLGYKGSRARYDFLAKGSRFLLIGIELVPKLMDNGFLVLDDDALALEVPS